MSFFFFCKQKTAYEMRISDWSSDVCSSDLLPRYWFQLADWIDDPSAAIADADALEKELLVSSELTGVLKAHRDDPRFVAAAAFAEKSEERRVGKGCVSTCRSRWSPSNKKKKNRRNRNIG